MIQTLERCEFFRVPSFGNPGTPPAYSALYVETDFPGGSEVAVRLVWEADRLEGGINPPKPPGTYRLAVVRGRAVIFNGEEVSDDLRAFEYYRNQVNDYLQRRRKERGL